MTTGRKPRLKSVKVIDGVVIQKPSTYRAKNKALKSARELKAWLKTGKARLSAK